MSRRARDTRLDRDVAVKVLPSALSADPEARARFEREAAGALAQVWTVVTHWTDELRARVK